MPSNPTAHLVHLVHLLMATNQRMRSSFKILVALYRIFHTLFSSFFSGSSMAHHIYCSSFGASQALLLLSVHPSARLWGSVRAVWGLWHDNLVTLRAAFLLCPSAGSCGAASADFPGSLGHRQDCFYLRAGSRLVTAISALHEVYLPLAPSRTSLGDVSSEWSSGA
jgi:hypothetical protein